MYLAAVLLLLVILPLASVAAQFFLSRHAVDAVFLVGRWFAFWAVGIRLFTAGVRQVIQPRFTAEEIFGAYENGSLALVREIGFANLSMGTLGICSLFRADWIVPAAIVGGLYYGLAASLHIGRKTKNAKEYTAMISDAFVFLVLLLFVIKQT